VRAKVRRDGILLKRTPSTLKSFDVHFAGVRVWSFSTEQRHVRQLMPWPKRLRDRLRGYTDIEVRDSADSSVLYASGRVHFDDSDHYFRLVDADGQPLMLNKWLRLAPMLDAGGETDQRELLSKLIQKLLKDLETLGHTVFAVGGTALGAYRDGDFFRYDDDGDLAVFFDTEHQIDVSRAMMKLERALRESGYWVRAHSFSHLQVYPADESFNGLYVDVFAAFFKGGYINQPFHVRAPFEHDDLLPFQSLEVRGVELPIARNAPKWFTANYDENWATPVPGFQLHTPQTTSRRFKSWFGTFNIHRHYWDAYVKDGEHEGDYRRVARDVAQAKPKLESPVIVNVGSGAVPTLPDDLEVTDDRASIYALDYSDETRQLAQQWVRNSGQGQIVVRDINANNYHQLLEFVAELPKKPFDVYLGFLLEGQTHKRRQTSVWRLVRMALLSGGSAVADYVNEPVEHVRGDDPRGWHLTDEEIKKEAEMHGLKAVPLNVGDVEVDGEPRSYTRVQFER
jgi:hypothetical protein